MVFFFFSFFLHLPPVSLLYCETVCEMSFVLLLKRETVHQVVKSCTPVCDLVMQTDLRGCCLHSFLLISAEVSD